MVPRRPQFKHSHRGKTLPIMAAMSDGNRQAMGDAAYLGRYLGIRERNGWEFATRTNATGVVVIVAVTANAEIVLVEQHRIPVEQNVIELPAGLVGDQGDPDEPLDLAAERELWEETGYRADRLRLIAHCPSSAGLTDEVLTIFLAENARREGPGGGDASEDITVHTVPLDQVDRWLAAAQSAGKGFDPKVYAALYWLERRVDLDAILPAATGSPAPR